MKGDMWMDISLSASAMLYSVVDSACLSFLASTHGFDSSIYLLVWATNSHTVSNAWLNWRAFISSSNFVSRRAAPSVRFMSSSLVPWGDGILPSENFSIIVRLLIRSEERRVG